jgi:protocatechuate 3,4-dioxygenase beta subunit
MRRDTLKRAGLIGALAIGAAIGLAYRADEPEEPVGSRVRYRERRPAPRPAVMQAESAATLEGNRATIEGSVIGPDGQPVAGAVVRLDLSPRPSPAPSLGLPPAPFSRTVTTTADGRFSFESLEPRAYAIAASTRDLIAGPYTVIDTDPPLVIRLAEAAFATVVVVDEDRRPVTGAQVQVRGWTATAQTDATGTAMLGPVQPGYRGIDVEAPGYAPTSGGILMGPAAAQAEHTIVLHRGWPVLGRVVDVNHQPIAGARITATSDRMYGADTLSDGRGEFVIPSLARGRYTLYAADDEHVAARSAVHATGGPVHGVEIVMTDGGVITGVVLDNRGTPAPFAEVRVHAGGPWMRGTAGPGGAFELRGLPRAPLVLLAETATALSESIRVDLSDSPAAEVELVLDTYAGTIAGRVVDEHGASLAGIRMTAYPDYGQLPLELRKSVKNREAITDGDGKFVFHGLDEVPYLLDARRQVGAVAGWPPRSVAWVGDSDVRIVLPSDGQLVGRIVVDRLDVPPRGIVVTLSGSITPANRDGSFQIKDISPGTHDMQVHGPGFQTFRRSVQIDPGATTDLGTLIATRSRTLAGRVVDRSGSPVAGARVELGVIRPEPLDVDEPKAGFHAYRTALTAPDGAFRVLEIPPAPMTAIASDPAYGSSAPVAVPGIPATPGDPPPITLVLSDRERR